MNGYAGRRLDAQTAEQLLAGDASARAALGPLAERLDAACAAALPGELAGEAAARAAFRAAAAMPQPPAGRRSSVMTMGAFAKRLTLKTAVAAAVAVSLGGAALAATTGVLPNPLTPQPPRSTAEPTHGDGPDATVSASVVGLCTAYVAMAAEAREHVVDNPAFRALVDAAGGAEKVPAFCDGLGVTAPGDARPTNHPGPRPTGPPTPGHPGGPPTGLPATSRR